MEYEYFPDSRRPTTGISWKTEPEQLEQVVAGADQRPLAQDLRPTPQQDHLAAPVGELRMPTSPWW